MKSIPVAVLGATGYAGETAVRILLGHPAFVLVHASSDRFAGTRLSDVVPSLAGETELVLGSESPEAILDSGAQAVILAKKSPEVTKIVPRLLDKGLRIVDIGAEFRLRSYEAYARWYKEPHGCPELLQHAVYGLSEWHTTVITQANIVGNPGCYATSILIPLLPLVRAQYIDMQAPLVVTSYSGVSGAGKRFLESNNNLFWAVNENLHCYKPVNHQHTGEIDQELSLAADRDLHCTFVPHLAPLTRGIHTTISARVHKFVTVNDIYQTWSAAYNGRRFVRIRLEPQQVEVMHVNGTNCIDIAATMDESTLLIVSALDNLVKGASGQAVQNLNLMFGLPEETGLIARCI